ncbi:MAG: PASTA domain-containing protein [Actinomycetota bacterium]
MKAIIFPVSLLLVILGACGSGQGSETTRPLPGEPVCIDESAEAAPDFVGLTEEDARDLAAERGLDVRVVGRDGECLAVTMDLRQDRVNLELIEDVVVGAAIY